MTEVLLGIGSNIAPERNIPLAMKKLRALDENCRFSRIFEFEAVGFSGANVYNLAAMLNTQLSLAELLAKLKQIELEQGRELLAKKFTDRSIDIDLLTFGTLCQQHTPVLPRSDIFHYAFVLLPLMDLCPDRQIPGTEHTYAKALDDLRQSQSCAPVSIVSFE